MRRPQRRVAAKQTRLREVDEIRLLNEWIDAGKPLPRTKLLPPSKSAGPVPTAGEHPEYGACTLFDELPLSQKTKDGLRKAGFTEMSEIQRAALPHALCGRDILGAAKTGSGKTLAFVIPLIEKLYRERWGPEDGVGCIILSPTNDLAGQIFEVIKKVGQFHNFSGGVIVGKQLLVLDEADQILDHGFRNQVDAIISQIPKVRQTLLFSATQTKSVKDLARVSLRDPEYISVHEEARTATPDTLEQYAMIVPLEQKLNMLWSFIKRHLNSKTIVFLSSVKQVKFVYEIFKKLRPGIPLKCMHGRMKHVVQQAIVADFNEATSVLFSTDITSRGLDIKNVDWVVQVCHYVTHYHCSCIYSHSVTFLSHLQVDCPENIDNYIHRVGRTARYNKKGKSLIFLCPEEEAMLEKLKATESKIPIHIRKPKAEQLEQISQSIASVLVKFPNLQELGKRAFVTYLKAVYLQKDKKVFNLSRFSAEQFAAYAASLGLPVTPKIRFISHKKNVSKKDMEDIDMKQMKSSLEHEVTITPKINIDLTLCDGDDDILYPKKPTADANMDDRLDDVLHPKESATDTNVTGLERPFKKKKLKINVNRPSGTRVKYDDEGNAIPPLASVAEEVSLEPVVHKDKISQRYAEMLREMQKHDKEDKLEHKKTLREKKLQKKMKLKRKRQEDTGAGSEEDSGSESDRGQDTANKGKKRYFNSDDEDNDAAKDGDVLAQQEALALKLLSNMHS
ncbi:DEAD-box ATP-dependent RNA helicase 32 [Zea mays]|uniref:ATP-dependent RNA helicase n=2 Tax=Zea mays TaxID=4577 RepID=A0A1D6EX34_MAIZE|nr:DEAD-box ATP-dependent RNA helicase 32 [Zea mays]